MSQVLFSVQRYNQQDGYDDVHVQLQSQLPRRYGSKQMGPTDGVTTESYRYASVYR